MSRRGALAVAIALALLVVVNVDIYRKQTLLADGRTLLLELAPVDPRSIMQGDYMTLRYALTRDAFPAADRGRLDDGYLVLSPDANGVARFRRRVADRDTALADDELLLRYRVRNGRPRIASDAFFFQEGEGERYQRARYGELRVDAAGEALLNALRDGDFATLGTFRP